jgi:hypothetical protein
MPLEGADMRLGFRAGLPTPDSINHEPRVNAALLQSRRFLVRPITGSNFAGNVRIERRSIWPWQQIYSQLPNG